MKFKKMLCAAMTAVMVFTGTALISCPVASAAETEISQQKTTIYIVGDSTSCIYGNDDDYAVPRAGWGMYLDKWLADESEAEVVDLALAGRSSKSFTVEDNYQTLCDNIKEGDFLLIQFGHNDAKSSTEEDLQNRYTDPEGDTQTEGSFKHSLYNNYVKLAQDNGATPILLTPVSRHKFDSEGKVTDSHGKYDDAVRELAEEIDIELVDATKLTEDLYNNIGQDNSRIYHAMYNDYTKGEMGYDNTHYSHLGAIRVSSMIAEDILSSSLSIEKYFNRPDIDKVCSFTRAEAAASIARLIGYDDEAGDVSFHDVSSDNKYYKGIYNAQQAGIILGDENGDFKPDEYASMTDILLMASRAFQKSMDIDKTEADVSIFDGYDVKDYAKSDIAVLVENDIIDLDTAMDVIVDAINIDNYSGRTFSSLVGCEIYDVKSEQVNADKEAEEQSLDELEKVEDTK